MLKLKRTVHKEIAQAQDLLVEELYKVFGNAVIHGGAAIWRCFKSNRFSEDIDVYIPKDIKEIDIFYKNIQKIGFSIVKKRIKQNSLFSVLKFNKSIVRFEAIFRKVNGILKEYEEVNGNLFTVYTLSPEQLLEEKVRVYKKRRKVRDLYDIFFLLRFLEAAKEIRNQLENFIKEFKIPIDKNELKVLIIEGIVPNVEQMLNYIKSKIQK